MAVSEKQRRLLRERRLLKRKEPVVLGAQPARERVTRKGLDRIYHDHYKAFLIITIGLLLFSFITIGATYARTGDVILKGVSLSGGLTLTIQVDEPIDVDALAAELRTQFPEHDFAVRQIGELGRQTAITIEAATPTNSQESLDELEDRILGMLSGRIPDIESRASAEIVGPSLGNAFFAQTAKAVLMAFVFMGMVVFLYFGDSWGQKALVTALSLVEAALIWFAGPVAITVLAAAGGAALIYIFIRYNIPSAAVILAAFSTIIFTIAVVDLIGLRISTAGVAAFLMLIGYSVDTDILLSNRVLKRAEGTVYERIVSTVKTGLTMTGTTFAASVIALIFTKSDVIREIMIIICIGLVADVFYTWVQNAGLLRLHLEKKGERP